MASLERILLPCKWATLYMINLNWVAGIAIARQLVQTLLLNNFRMSRYR